MLDIANHPSKEKLQQHQHHDHSSSLSPLLVAPHNNNNNENNDNNSTGLEDSFIGGQQSAALSDHQINDDDDESWVDKVGHVFETYVLGTTGEWFDIPNCIVQDPDVEDVQEEAAKLPVVELRRLQESGKSYYRMKRELQKKNPAASVKMVLNRDVLKLPQQTFFTTRFGHYFDCYRGSSPGSRGCHWFIIADLLSAGILGVSDGLIASFGCSAIGWILIAIFFGYVLSLVVLRPMATRFEGIFVTIVAFLQLAAAAVAVLTSGDADAADPDSPSQQAVANLTSAALMIGTVQVLFITFTDLVKYFVNNFEGFFASRHHKKMEAIMKQIDKDEENNDTNNKQDDNTKENNNNNNNIISASPLITKKENNNLLNILDEEMKTFSVTQTSQVPSPTMMMKTVESVSDLDETAARAAQRSATATDAILFSSHMSAKNLIQLGMTSSPSFLVHHKNFGSPSYLSPSSQQSNNSGMRPNMSSNSVNSDGGVSENNTPPPPLMSSSPKKENSLNGANNSMFGQMVRSTINTPSQSYSSYPPGIINIIENPPQPQQHQQQQVKQQQQKRKLVSIIDDDDDDDHYFQQSTSRFVASRVNSIRDAPSVTTTPPNINHHQTANSMNLFGAAVSSSSTSSYPHSSFHNNNGSTHLHPISFNNNNNNNPNINNNKNILTPQQSSSTYGSRSNSPPRKPLDILETLLMAENEAASVSAAKMTMKEKIDQGKKNASATHTASEEVGKHLVPVTIPKEVISQQQQQHVVRDDHLRRSSSSSTATAKTSSPYLLPQLSPLLTSDMFFGTKRGPSAISQRKSSAFSLNNNTNETSTLLSSGSTLARTTPNTSTVLSNKGDNGKRKVNSDFDTSSDEDIL